MSSVLEFPVWVIVNLQAHASKGLSYSIIKVGPGPSPDILPIFTSKEIAEDVYKRRNGLPDGWGYLQVDREALYNVLNYYIMNGGVSNVTFDFGTEQARKYTIEDFLKVLRPESQN